MSGDDTKNVLGKYQSIVFDWLILEGAYNDHTQHENNQLPQFQLYGMDLFLGCATTHNPDHIVELAVLGEAGDADNEDEVWRHLADFMDSLPKEIVFDITTTDRTHVWIAWPMTVAEIDSADFDGRMRDFLAYANAVVDYVETTNWNDPPVI